MVILTGFLCASSTDRAGGCYTVPLRHRKSIILSLPSITVRQADLIQDVVIRLSIVKDKEFQIPNWFSL